jgi:phage terminase large subunit-like protein
MPAWDACEGIVDLSALKGERCFIGADLSATQDYTAVVAVFPRPDGRYLVKAWFWVPQETLFERERTDKVDVVGWERDGLVTATPGKVIDQDAIKFKLLSLAKEFEVIEIPMDPHNATKLQTELMAHGLPVVNHPQGWISMSPAIKATEILILSEKLVHDGNPVLRWMFGNVALEISSRDNRSFHKGKSTDRIDGQVALAMAIGRSQASEGPSIYESRGLVVIGGDPE